MIHLIDTNLDSRYGRGTFAFISSWWYVSVASSAGNMHALWVALNSTSQDAINPYPFPLLSTFLSLEAVLLTSCVLIRKNSIYRTSERRDHLEFQINLLAEQEATRSLDMLQRIADHLNLPNNAQPIDLQLL